MKRILLSIVVIALMSSAAIAAEKPEVCFTWTQNPVDATLSNAAVGYRIYRDATTPKQFVFPDMLQSDVCNDATKECTKCLPNIADGLNHRYNATAYNAIGESDFSNNADKVILGASTPIPPIEQNPAAPGKMIYLAVPVGSVIVQ